MDNGMAQVLESVFGKRELDAVSVEEIRELIAEFPSFNAGHYFLSKKLKTADAIDFAAANRQTALYFNNPLWLEHLLEDEGPDELTRAAEPDAVMSSEAIHTLHEDKPTASEWLHTAPEDTPTVNEVLHTQQEDAPTINELLHTAQDDAPTVNEVQQAGQDDLATVNEIIETTEPTLNETLEPVMNEAVEAFDAAGQATETESLLNETFGGVNQEDTLTPDDMPQPDPMFDDNPAFEWPAESAPDLTLAVTDAPEGDAITAPQRLSDDLAAAARAFSSVTLAGGAGFDEKKAKSIVFEPYHTIDYFASQGIKLVLEDKPADSFGRQLKSFTDWLKTMKRLPVQPLTGKADEAETAEVRHFAADSVEDRDVLTETMAEVLVKQGMNDNAIAIYEKLSLINPLKSAYFAARIQQLKDSLT